MHKNTIRVFNNDNCINYESSNYRRIRIIGSNFILQLLEKNQNIQITNVDGEFYGSNSQNLVKLKIIYNTNMLKET